MRKPLYEARRHATSDNDALLQHAPGDDRGDCRDQHGRAAAGRAVSEAIVSRFVAGFDAVAIFGAGVAAMHWDPSGVDWRLEGLVSCWAPFSA